MNKADILNRVLVMLGKEDKSKEEEKITLAEVTTTEGVILVAEAFEPGQPIFMLDGENQVPAEAGSYTVESVGVITVEEVGVIAAVEAVEEEAAAAEEVTAEEELKAEEKAKGDDKAAKATKVEEEVTDQAKTELTRKEVATMIKEGNDALIEQIKAMLPTDEVNLTEQKNDKFIKPTPEGDQAKKAKPAPQGFATMRPPSIADRVNAKLFASG